MADYWRSCGYQLLDRTPEGHLVVTDAFLKFLLDRPEMAPVPESCAGELALREHLMRDPRADVPTALLGAVTDEDARANYAVWLRFRKRLLAHDTLEASYAAVFRGEGVDVPPLLIHLLTQVLLRHILGDEPPALQARAAEMLFRPQRIAIQDDGQVMAADDETVERYATAANFGSVGEMLKQGGAPLRAAELDVLHETRAEDYWSRDEAHDFVVSLNHGHPALTALCVVLERWVQHFLGCEVRIQPERAIDEQNWVWHVGLDAQASSVLNDLYDGKDVSDERRLRMLCLFTLEFVAPSAVRPEVAGRPVYLGMAKDELDCLRIKPQNLLLNLPLGLAA